MELSILTQRQSPAARSSRFKNRRERRFPVRMFVSYRSGHMRGEGEVVDIYARGWKVMGEIPAVAGTILQLDVQGSDALSPITIDCAKVLWAKDRLFCVNVEAAL